MEPNSIRAARLRHSLNRGPTGSGMRLIVAHEGCVAGLNTRGARSDNRRFVDSMWVSESIERSQLLHSFTGKVTSLLFPSEVRAGGNRREGRRHSPFASRQRCPKFCLSQVGIATRSRGQPQPRKLSAQPRLTHLLLRQHRTARSKAPSPLCGECLKFNLNSLKRQSDR